MLQVEFNNLYDKLLKFALHRARAYFHDQSMCQDAAEAALNKFVDAYMETTGVNDLEAWAKTVIVNSLKNTSRDRELEPTNVVGQEFENFHGYEVK